MPKLGQIMVSRIQADIGIGNKQHPTQVIIEMAYANVPDDPGGVLL